MSNFLDYDIKTRDQFRAYILRQLGDPLITVELTSDMINDTINEAVEIFTKYASQDQDYIALNLSGYTSASGLILPSNVTSVFTLDDNAIGLAGTDVNRLFSIPNAMMNAGMLVVPNPGEGWGWVNYHLAMSHLDLMKRILGGGFDFQYNPRTKSLKLIPDPVVESLSGWIVLGVNVIRGDTYQYGEEWVKKYALALSKILLGRVRSKYTGVQLLGGGTLDISVLAEGKEERDKLMDDLRSSEGGVFGFYVG